MELSNITQTSTFPNWLQNSIIFVRHSEKLRHESGYRFSHYYFLTISELLLYFGESGGREYEHVQKLGLDVWALVRPFPCHRPPDFDVKNKKSKDLRSLQNLTLDYSRSVLLL